MKKYDRIPIPDWKVIYRRKPPVPEGHATAPDRSGIRSIFPGLVSGLVLVSLLLLLTPTVLL